MKPSLRAGAWEWKGGDIWAISPWNARAKIATVYQHSPMNLIDSEANGRLIAAAPELLRAALLGAAYDDLLRGYTGPR